MMKRERKGANAAPMRLAIQINDCARPVSDLGNQREITMVAFGYAPASPIPNRNRMINNMVKVLEKPVNMVNTDQERTILKSMDLGPFRSPHNPTGISNKP